MYVFMDGGALLPHNGEGRVQKPRLREISLYFALEGRVTQCTSTWWLSEQLTLGSVRVFGLMLI